MKGVNLISILSFDIILLLILSVSFQSTTIHNNPVSEYLFTFAHITDSHVSKTNTILEKVTSWLAQQKNISFVVHTGDIVTNPQDEKAWKKAHDYMHQLDGRCKWAVLAGDNDVVYRNRLYLTNYVKYFGNESIDQYIVIEDKLLFILFSWNSTDGSISEERLEWMDEIIDEYKDLYVIICLHPYLSELPILNLYKLPNSDEFWRHIDKHDNVIIILSGHIHRNWVLIHLNKNGRVWSISTENLSEKGYIRLFQVYSDKIIVYGFSPITNQKYTGSLDYFTIELNENPDGYDVDGDLWRDDWDIMPTDPSMPNIIVIPALIGLMSLVCWIKRRHK